MLLEFNFEPAYKAYLHSRFESALAMLDQTYRAVEQIGESGPNASYRYVFWVGGQKMDLLELYQMSSKQVCSLYWDLEEAGEQTWAQSKLADFRKKPLNSAI